MLSPIVLKLSVPVKMQQKVLSANFFNIIFWLTTGYFLICMLLKSMAMEQSDLCPHCLLQRLPNTTAEDKADNL